jgi:hypothetical protein
MWVQGHSGDRCNTSSSTNRVEHDEKGYVAESHCFDEPPISLMAEMVEHQNKWEQNMDLEEEEDAYTVEFVESFKQQALPFSPTNYSKFKKKYSKIRVFFEY